MHNIWTPILYGIQKHIYQATAKIITNEDEVFFIKNAARDIDQKPHSKSKVWNNNTAIMERLESTKQDIVAHNPKLVITFGAFAFEFMRRCYITDETTFCKEDDWNVEALGKAFRKSIHENEILTPLLHHSISMGNWFQCHERFTTSESANYFDYAAENLYKKIIPIVAP